MYIKKIYIAGVTIEIEKTYSGRYGKKIQRSKNENPTPQDVQKVNERKACDELRRSINHNFTYKDLFITLTYQRKYRPTPAEAKARLEKFIRNLRKEYKKHGKELKYIKVTEYGTEEEPKAIHHHLIINNIDFAVITDLWTWGRPHCTMLDATGDYSNLANYIIKETRLSFGKKRHPYAKRWTPSRNLEKVEPIIEVVEARKWRKEPVSVKGYVIDVDSIRSGVSDVTGYPYQFYRMIKIDLRE